MNSSVFFVTLIVLCLENVTSLICLTKSAPPPKWPAPVQEQQSTTWSTTKELECYSEGEVVEIDCESTELYHQRYQGYQNGTGNGLAIGIIPRQDGISQTRYSLSLEKFDNNTQIYCQNKNDSNSYGKKKSIKLFGNETNNTRILEHISILRYSERESISFSCEKYAKDKNDTFVGRINTTSNIITTVQKPVLMDLALKKADNGTILLCCIYYEVNETDGVTKITRRVANKTLLIYDNTTARQDSLTEKSTTPYIVSFSAVGGALILLLSIVLCKKWCRKKPTPDNKILYADLDMLRNVEPERPVSKPEEDPYAEIIGVMKHNQ